MQWQEIFSSPYFSDSLLCQYILLYDGFWGYSLGVKRPGREADHPAITLLPLYEIMAWTGQLGPVAVMTVRESSLGKVCWFIRTQCGKISGVIWAELVVAYSWYFHKNCLESWSKWPVK